MSRNRAVQQMTVTDGRYIRPGDLLRVTGPQAPADTLVVTASRGRAVRSIERVGLARAVWNWLRRRGWKRERVERYADTVRFYRARPSPLPRRLP